MLAPAGGTELEQSHKGSNGSRAYENGQPHGLPQPPGWLPRDADLGQQHPQARAYDLNNHARRLPTWSTITTKPVTAPAVTGSKSVVSSLT
jgi:hypothetical protein